MYPVLRIWNPNSVSKFCIRIQYQSDFQIRIRILFTDPYFVYGFRIRIPYPDSVSRFHIRIPYSDSGSEIRILYQVFIIFSKLRKNILKKLARKFKQSLTSPIHVGFPSLFCHIHHKIFEFRMQTSY